MKLNNFDQIIYDTVLNQTNNKNLSAFIVAQAKSESGNYKSSLFKRANNCFGHKFSQRSQRIGNAKQEERKSPEGDHYAVYPDLASCIKVHLDLYRDGGRYSGILYTTYIGDFLKKLEIGGYAPGYEQDYRKTLPSILRTMGYDGNTIVATKPVQTILNNTNNKPLIILAVIITTLLLLISK